jgi:hypothetical protein
MNLNEALHILAPTFTVATRDDRKRVIEKAIAEFCCDGIEASEFLDAMQASLTERYGADNIADILHLMRPLHFALREQEETANEEDQREALQESHYRDWIARREED